MIILSAFFSHILGVLLPRLKSVYMGHNKCQPFILLVWVPH